MVPFALGAADTYAVGHLITDLDNLQDGMVRGFQVMVSRRWDNETPRGEYLSTEYLLSDRLGNIVQCTVLRRGPLSLSPQLFEGRVYHIRDVLVIEHEGYLRVCRNNNCKLIFLRRTTVTEVRVDITGFIRHPFNFVEFEDITHGQDQYLIDVTGHVHSVGRIFQLPGSCAWLDVKIINARGTVLEVTLWGRFTEDFLARRAYAPGGDAFIFAGMEAVQGEDGIYLTATMDTSILCAPEITAPHQLTRQLASLYPYKN